MAGIGSTPALLVARGVLRSMGAGKLVGVLSMLLVGMAGGAGMLAHQATSPERGEQGQTMHARSDSAATALLFSEGRPKVSPAPKDEADGNSSRQSIVAGRVLDAGGKPVAGIEVAVVGGLNTLPRGIYAEEPHDLLATGRTGVDGRIRLRVTHFVPERYWGSVALVAAPGYALAWQRLDFHLEPAEFTLRLAREQVIYGRLVTLEGQPAAGVKVEVSAVDIQPFGAGVANNAISWRKGGKRVPGWPGPATSDAQGRFVLHGIGRNQVANLEIVDDRFAFQAMRVQNGEDPAQVFTAALHPAQLVEGTVTCADTGKPVPGAQLALKFERSGAQQNFPWVPYFEGGQTDAQGRFKINPMPATYVAVAAYPPEGIPYLPVEKPIEPHARSVVRLHADVGLPAGVRVRGRIVDEETQQPVANGTITCTRMQAGNPFYRKDVLSDRSWPTTSGADCTFAITVPPGPCTLLIHGGNEYILQETNSDSLSRGRRGGWKLYAHAIVKLDYKPGDQPTEMTVKLRRGVSIKGRLVGPNGEPVDEAVVITPLQVSPRTSGWQGGAKVRQGTFEVKGCEPGKAYTLHFLEPKRCWGAMVSATAHEPGEPITVRLAPCGSATLRAQDRDGRPRAGWWPALELIMGPGTASLILAQQKGEVAADHTVVSNFDRYHHADLRTDAQGKVTLPALIPGARYELNRMDGSPRVFTVSAGQTLDLGTFTVERD